MKRAATIWQRSNNQHCAKIKRRRRKLFTVMHWWSLLTRVVFCKTTFCFSLYVCLFRTFKSRFCGIVPPNMDMTMMMLLVFWCALLLGCLFYLRSVIIIFLRNTQNQKLFCTKQIAHTKLHVFSFHFKKKYPIIF